MQRNLINYRQLLFHKYKTSINYGFASTANELASGYKPRDVEASQNVVSPVTPQPHLPAYSFILPPPNVTGNLHLGHALMCTVQDAIARHRRSTGHDVCWVPGTDHAGIATQVVVEKHLRKLQGVGRHELGRKRFVDEVWKWRSEKGHRIKEDLIKMSTTMNWEKEYFTMDDHQSLAVRQAFIRLFDDGLIYRGESLVNWCCSLESTISDIEVDTVDITGPTFLTVPNYEKPVAFGHITDLAYLINDKRGEKIVVSTTRPETMLGDVAVAVHPEDQRYVHLRGSNTQLWHPFRKEPIPLVFDESVDRDLGTGAVKITPAHDRFDFDLAKRHSLPTIAVINEQGLIREEFGEFGGTPRFAARETIKHRLADLGHLVGTRPHSMQLPVCSRSKDIIEHMLKPQWFVRCDEMSKEAISVVETGQLNIQPDNFRAEWHRWLSESRDWCISRQLWWGHSVPAYECTALGKSVWIAAHNEEEAHQKAARTHFNNLNDPSSISVRQDGDVLDTWFSSALLPFSAFGWPNNKGNADFNRNYPQDLLETGHDILFFWVARMVMLGKYLTGEVPFRNVLLHGIVCDAQGRKMSKSLGNVIVPHQVVHGASLKQLQAETREAYDMGILSTEQYQRSITDQAKMFPTGIPECGTDALRFTLLGHNLRTHFINFDPNECYTNKLFFNKVWQATRFTIGAHRKWSLTEGVELQTNDLGVMDRWILSRLARSMQMVDRAMDGMQFHVAVAALKTFFYQNFCDVYLETTKHGLSGVDRKVALNHCVVLNECLRIGLGRMAPITPSLSQELLEHIKRGTMSQPMLTSYLDDVLEKKVEEMLSICAAVRQLKSENRVTRKHDPTVHLHITDAELLNRLQNHQHDIESLTLCNQVLLTADDPLKSTANDRRIVARSTAGPQCSFAIEVQQDTLLNAAAAEIPTGDSVNDKKLQKLEADLERLQRTVANEGFQRSASAKVQQQHSEKIKRITSELQSIQRLRKEAV